MSQSITKTAFGCHVLLIVITVFAAVLRFYQLGEWSFWGDEMFTVSGREDGFNYSFVRQSVSMSLIQSVVSWLGISEWSARLVPALFGVASVPILFVLVKKMFNPTTGLAAALLLAVSPWHLYWSQNSRFYVPLLLFYTLALFTFYFGFEEDNPWYLVASFIFLGIAAKERLLALFFVPVVLGYLLLVVVLPFKKPDGLRWRNLAILFLPGMMAGAFFVGPYVSDLSGWMQGFGYVNNNPVWILAGVVYYIGIPVMSVATLGTLYFFSQRNRAVLLLSLSAIIPVAGIMAISLFHYAANRYVFVSLTSWLVLAALAAVELIRQSQRDVKILATVVLCFLVLAPLGENALYFKYQNGNRDDWKGAFEFVKEHKLANDKVFSNNSELGNFYLQEETIGLANLNLDQLESGEERVWFVQDMVAKEIYPNLHQWLTNEARLVANYDVHANARIFTMRIYLYENTKPDQNLAQ